MGQENNTVSRPRFDGEIKNCHRETIGLKNKAEESSQELLGLQLEQRKMTQERSDEILTNIR